MFRKMGVLALTITLFSGCANGIKMSNYKELDCDKKDCEIQPPEYIVNKKKPKVAILPLADVTEFDGKLSKSANETLTQTLTSGTGLEVVERSQMDKLFEEVKFKGNITGDIDPTMLTSLAKDLDFVILGSVSSVSEGAKFTEASSYRDKKGYLHNIAASCTVSAEATVNIRAVSTKTGSIYKVFTPFKGKVSGSSEVRSSSQCQIGDPFQLAQQATAKSIENGKDSFMEAFPNYGYVSKTMTNPGNGKDRIAEITLGKNNGLKAGDKVMLGRYEKSFDRIKKTESLAIHDVTEVTISETGLGDDQSFITLPEEFANDVTVGYIVKTKANKSMFKSFRNMVNS
jgi:curli biogenesis system outer membrane secretion channel CsgG